MVINGKSTVCYGCGVCATACPHKAINIALSEEGFWVPFVDKSKCTNCGICDKVCAYIDRECCLPLERLKNVKAYSIINNDSEILKYSTSGGAGYAIASFLIDEGYTLVGVKYDNERNIACHFKTNDLEEFKKTLNSKYIPSYTVEGFEHLMDGKKYAVFGTPCQIDSLRRWSNLKKKSDNFIFIDLFCHGVPSYLHWNAYLKYHLRKGEKLQNPIFRDKRNGWHAYTMSLQTNQRRISTRLQNNDFFQNLFFGNYTLNQSCYQCIYRGHNSAADIRMGDLWGGKYAHNEEGITGVLALTVKGNYIIEKLKNKCLIDNEDEDIVTAGQLHNNLPIPKSRNKLLQGFRDDKSLFQLYYLYATKMWIKNLIPYNIKRYIKLLIYHLRK